MKKTPFRLVRDDLSHDTVQALEQLLAQARRGEIIGVAFAAMYRQRQFIVNSAGECHRNPVFTRGMVASLHDEVGQRVRDR